MVQWLCIAFLLLAAPIAASAEIYDRVAIEPNGQLHIYTEDRREIVPVKDKDQTGFQQAAIAPDRRTVGWLALYPNCCTSYPIPLKLVIYSDGKTRVFTGKDLPIWRWRFLSSGKHVAFEQETVHGGLGVHYELRGVTSGELAAEYDPDPENAATPPGWVRKLDSEK
ncbi:MAG: hypothetical protein ACU83V_12905 [Gammaproteobacteria bacterium]